MAFVVQYAPSAQTVGQFSYAAGVGQFQQRQQELRLRDEAQMRGIAANLYSAQAARDAAAVRQQAQIQAQASLAEKTYARQLTRDALRRHFDAAGRQQSFDLQRELFGIQQQGIIERHRQTADQRGQLALAARQHAEGLEVDGLNAEADYYRDWVLSQPKSIWSDTQLKQIAAATDKEEGLEGETLNPVHKAGYRNGIWKQLAEMTPHGEPPKSAAEIVNQAIVEREDGSVGIVQPPDGPKIDWKPPPKKEDVPEPYKSPADYAARDMAGYGKLISDLMKSNEGMTGAQAAEELHAAHRKTLELIERDAKRAEAKAKRERQGTDGESMLRAAAAARQQTPTVPGNDSLQMRP